MNKLYPHTAMLELHKTNIASNNYNTHTSALFQHLKTFFKSCGFG